jgi:hypothetical protein
VDEAVRVKRPAQFTEADETDICTLASDIYQDVAHDLGRCSVHDFMDVFYGYLPSYARETYPAADAVVARDAEREGREHDLRTKTIASDVYAILINWDAPEHRWAMWVAEQHMRKKWAHRGRLG